MVHQGKKICLLLFIIPFGFIWSQIDTTLFKIDRSKLNDSVTRITQTVFNPGKGIYISNELNKYYLGNNLIEENTSFSGRLNGLCKKYYINGQIKEISNYIVGSRVGIFCEFYDNGKIKSIGDYYMIYNDSIVNLNKPKIVKTVQHDKNGNNNEIITIEYNQGLKNGKWLYYDKNGKLLKEETWIKGVLETKYPPRRH